MRYASTIIFNPSCSSPKKIIVPSAKANTSNANMESSIVPNIHINSQMSRVTVSIRVIGNNNILSGMRIMNPPFLSAHCIKKEYQKKEILSMMQFLNSRKSG